MAEPQQNVAAQPETTTGGRRRVRSSSRLPKHSMLTIQESSGFMPGFESLANQKRGSDANIARRASLSDQAPKTGIFSQFFHKYV